MATTTFLLYSNISQQEHEWMVIPNVQTSLEAMSSFYEISFSILLT